MRTSLYYSAIRNTPMAQEEQSTVRRLVFEANAAAPYRNEERLFLYPKIPPGTLLEGSTEMPLAPSRLQHSLHHWLEALTALRRTLPEAEWSVALEDVEAEWSETAGYRFRGVEDPVGLVLLALSA